MAVKKQSLHFSSRLSLLLFFNIIFSIRIY